MSEPMPAIEPVRFELLDAASLHSSRNPTSPGYCAPSSDE